MRMALDEARKAEDILEVPIGAVVVYGDKVVGRGFNKRESLNNPVAHAEIIAIEEASRYLGRWRLEDCSLYVTIEPCPMCAGAIINSRIDRLVIGAMDKKSGACGSVINLVENENFNHRVDLEIGILEDECSSIMSNFFRKLRENKK